MDAVLRRDLSFYDSYPSGKIVSRVNSDTQAFSAVVTLTTDLMSQFLLVVLLIGYLFTVSPRLTAILLVLAPLIVATALGFRHIARKTITQSRRVQGRGQRPHPGDGQRHPHRQDLSSGRQHLR